MQGWLIAVIVVGVILFIVAHIPCVYWIVKYIKARYAKSFLVSLLTKRVQESNVREYRISDMATATENFSPGSVLGEGAFGVVYRGVDKDGRLIAVKRFKKITPMAEKEFEAEVLTISQLNHKNLVKLLGYCSVPGKEQILVYEFVPNDTLRKHLDAVPPQAPLTFVQRIDIALQCAQALQYLHSFSSPAILHRDVKSSNILLSETMQAKVADFGLFREFEEKAARGAMKQQQSKAKLSGSDKDTQNETESIPLSDQAADVENQQQQGSQQQGSTGSVLPEGTEEGEYGEVMTGSEGVTTRVAGTPGYIDPEYYSSMRASTKVDVYSFGVVLLELITGRPPIFRDDSSPDNSRIGLVSWATPRIVDGHFDKLCDPKLKGVYPPLAMKMLCIVAATCVLRDSMLRPEMESVVLRLTQVKDEAATVSEVNSDEMSGVAAGNANLDSQFESMLGTVTRVVTAKRTWRNQAFQILSEQDSCSNIYMATVSTTDSSSIDRDAFSRPNAR